MMPSLLLGTKTKWGKVAAIMMLEGERYYFLVQAATKTKTQNINLIELRRAIFISPVYTVPKKAVPRPWLHDGLTQ